MKIALAQMDIIWENIKGNEQKAESFFMDAKKEEADWIIFPEMTLTGFSMNTSMAVYYEEQVDYFKAKAREYGLGIVFGVIAPGEGGKFENHMIIVNEHGEKIMEYAKIHPFSYGAEAKYYTGGNKVCACNWKGINLSGFICYDLRFPSIFQIASEKCHVIFVIANWPVERINQWDALLRARAIEGCCYVVGVNRAGDAGRLHYTGHSAIYDFQGKCITELCEKEKLIVGDINPDKVEKYRKGFPAIQDRRPELYQTLKLIES